ncbi:HNH endonuclease domain protein [Plesiocystis pacifica SIR-1]|uniref:HNH endonuclease domain protein n=1 Tax=Plesiocystis pacifica SIR-1 TaxID=391625 RepID=A6G3R0_9BACT|nr:HNH endonuclease [Plesiocystis pacifica]EDM79447.1 HNH endonuclease domain protein [Plesiocystis pacifica SIR-1]
MRNRTRRLLLWCAATDSTFALARQRDRTVLAGKCIHCKRKLAVDLEGNALSHETVEHIVPRTHGGTDAVENLAIACARCNQGKGVRQDPRPWSDPGLQAVIATLQARRAERMREPPEGLELPPRPGAPEPEPEADDGPVPRTGRKSRSRAASRRRKR